MKRILNYCTMLLVSALAFSLGSCTDEYEYNGGSADGEQVYFSNKIGSTVELTPNASSVQVPINRINRAGEKTVGIDVQKPANSKLTIGNEVTFADGDSVAYLTINYNPSQITYGDYETVTLTLIEEAGLTSPYGSSTITVAVGMSEWKDMAGQALYREGIFSSLYGTELMTYNVKIQENVVVSGKYRLVSPYGETSKFYTTYKGALFTLADKPNTDIVIDASDPDFVYISENFSPGLDDGFSSQGQGVFNIISMVADYLEAGNPLDLIKAQKPELFGKLKDGVITFPAQVLGGYFDSNPEAMYYANSDQLAVALPGYTISDFSSTYTYNGRFTDVAGNNYAEGTITLGEDVASAKYVVAADGDDINTIIDGIVSGSIEANEISATGNVSVKLEESGKYTMVIVTFDAEGKMRGSSATTFTFNIGGGEDDANWEALTTGSYDQNYYPNFISDQAGNFPGNPFGDGIYTTTLYVDAEDEWHFKIEPWLLEDGKLEFTVDSNNGLISFEDVNTGVDSGQYGYVFVTNANKYMDDPYSGITQKGTFQFGMMYYGLDNGKEAWFGGGIEIFTPDENIFGSSKKLKAIAAMMKNQKMSIFRNQGMNFSMKKGFNTSNPVIKKNLRMKGLR